MRQTSAHNLTFDIVQRLGEEVVSGKYSQDVKFPTEAEEKAPKAAAKETAEVKEKTPAKEEAPKVETDKKPAAKKATTKKPAASAAKKKAEDKEDKAE